ncbi:hypothetical protein GYMLUDRAFT_252383 [Collybiopsis luxurians FD-317 M1]|uniref:Uncharacterized protein n=1 Tax=Collybiopsis luxurians FD-317 M1 TaxID=944289 RepID=A0A0D0C8L0_9AGAR|nr:hypothetical protein GYMLUDRAFT_252383 [Collybiopsis luxurians FD-317 M1]
MYVQRFALCPLVLSSPQAREVNELGIKLIIINGDTVPQLSAKDWKEIENHSTYRHFALSPEQVQEGSQVPRF